MRSGFFVVSQYHKFWEQLSINTVGQHNHDDIGREKTPIFCFAPLAQQVCCEKKDKAS